MPKDTYRVVVNGTHSFDLSGEDMESQEIVPVKDGFQMRFQNKNYDLQLDRSGTYNYTVSVNGMDYAVHIKNDLALLIDKMGFQKQQERNIKQVRAPMPGLVLEILVKAGQEVKEDVPLLVLEAMKMENSMLSPATGVIKSISVKKGDAVNKGQLLIEFE